MVNDRLSFWEAIYAYFYRRRKREAEAKRVGFDDVKIISVGNLTTGGTGKTPAVQWLSRRLQDEGMAVAVIGRGYGGLLSAQGAVVSDGKEILLNAKQAGDEAVSHARALPSASVLIGRDRVAAVELAKTQFAPQVIVLDDAFQYWSLERDFDLVLLDAHNPFGNGKLLPFGRLREPQTELARASGVLLTRADGIGKSQLAAVKEQVRRFTDAPVFVSRHRPHSLYEQDGGKLLGLEVLQSMPVAAFSALADNQRFFESLRFRGAEVKSTLARRDHHHWREQEIRGFISKIVRDQSARAVVTTEKDAVKISPEWCAPLPLLSLRIELEIEEENALWQLVKTIF